MEDNLGPYPGNGMDLYRKVTTLISKDKIFNL